CCYFWACLLLDVVFWWLFFVVFVGVGVFFVGGVCFCWVWWLLCGFGVWFCVGWLCGGGVGVFGCWFLWCWCLFLGWSLCVLGFGVGGGCGWLVWWSWLMF
ncbi:hypothetical protein, partial [Pseudomonas syringae group genomosp. 7]|uniref:hypothetical protein n=1 Tax=Pseudomonas syringae group genomosp. 7 TaxID=251699 RepID=UPI0037705869